MYYSSVQNIWDLGPDMRFTPFMDLLYLDWRKGILKLDPEDIIAIVAGIVAIMFAAAMIAGWVPINKYTVGIVGFSGAGVVIAKIVKARSGKAPAKPKPKKS
jgi:hypothetical protein